MWTYNSDDELKNKLKYDITMWYKHWFMGTDETLIKHLELFDKHYDPRLFDNEEELSNNIKKFLTFLQNEIGKIEID